jgi:hypothetical protein
VAARVAALILVLPLLSDAALPPALECGWHGGTRIPRPTCGCGGRWFYARYQALVCVPWRYPTTKINGVNGCFYVDRGVERGVDLGPAQETDDGHRCARA